MGSLAAVLSSLFRNAGYFVLVFAVLAGALAFRIWDPTPVARMRLLAFDAYQRIEPRAYDVNLPVRIIDIDETSLARTGQWPWPRTLVSDLVTRLRDAGAAAIAFDMVFPEADRLSPGTVLSSVPQDLVPEDVRTALSALPSNDTILADTLAQSPVVLGVVLNNNTLEAPPTPLASIAFAGDDPAPFLTAFNGATGNLDMLEANAKGLGALNWIPGVDQVIRRVPLLVRTGDQIYPSLSVEALRIALGASTIIVKSSGASGITSFGESTGIVALRVGSLTVPTDGSGYAWIHFTPFHSERYIPAWKVLEGVVGPEELGGRIILIGSSAAGLFDLQTTPIDAGVPGVDAHAQAIESIFTGALLSRPDYANGLELTYLFVAAVLLIFLMRYLAVHWCLIACLVCLGVVNVVSWLAFKESKLLLDPVYPSLALICVFVAGELNLFFRTERERRYIRGAFSRYLSPDLVERLGEHHAELELGGEIREMTLMFCDVRGFTQISENLSASELTSLINKFLTPMSGAILEHHGTIDKYMGDAIMAFWNAPLDDKDHARNACLAARDMIAALGPLNEQLEAEAQEAGRAFVPIRIGIGINTGEACVGNMGSSHRFDYSVIGDNVNIASRLEGQTKSYGVTILLGERTKELSLDEAVLELDQVKVKGKQQAERVFTMLASNAADGTDSNSTLQEEQTNMLAAYRGRDWGRAREAIDACRAVCPEPISGYYDAMEERLALFEMSPPPADWDGTFEAETK